MFWLLLTACITDADLLDRMDWDDDGYYVEESGVPPFDCDDFDDAVHPGADEICDEIDNNCDGDIDGADAATAVAWFRDADGDGWGSDTDSQVACRAPDGYAGRGGDCDDLASAVHPEAVDDCDDVDTDCDGTIDEDKPRWYPDADGDGYGDDDGEVQACDQPSGYISSSGDCQDDDGAIHPDADESCDGVDNDCDGLTDDEDDDVVDLATWYQDGDGDGHGTEAGTEHACVQPDGFASAADDCDDGDADVSPSEPEVCESGADEDCDSLDSTCGISGDVSLTDASASFQASSGADFAGRAVSAVGDADGDGFPDWAIAAPGHNDYQGRTYLFSGTSDLLLGASALEDADAILEGSTEGDVAGIGLAGGDLDGDGYSDLVIGAPTAGTGPGQVHLLLGGPKGLAGTVDLTKATATIEGEGSTDGLGWSASVVGDVNGDARDDALLGADGYDSRSWRGVPVSGRQLSPHRDAFCHGRGRHFHGARPPRTRLDGPSRAARTSTGTETQTCSSVRTAPTIPPTPVVPGTWCSGSPLHWARSWTWPMPRPHGQG